MQTIKKLGKDLKVNDTIEVWWEGGRDTILKLEDYPPLSKFYISNIFKDGAKLAVFARNKSGMTIDLGDYYNVIIG